MLAIKKLHSGRVPGPHGLELTSRRMLTFVLRQETMWSSKTSLNALFASGKYVLYWSVQCKTECSEFKKKGDASPLGSYRAIAVGSVFERFYAVVLDAFNKAESCKC